MWSDKGIGVGVPSGRKVGRVDSIICLVHRLGMGRPAEQAALVPGPALSSHQPGCWGRVPWPGRTRPVQTPRPYGSLESMGSSNPPSPRQQL